jgi:hypothetical protein
MHLHIRMGGQEVGDLRRLMGRQVVGDDVDLARRSLRTHDRWITGSVTTDAAASRRVSTRSGCSRSDNVNGVEVSARHTTTLSMIGPY